MRWKLLLTASLVATVIGAGVPLAIIAGLSGSPRRLLEPDTFVLGTLLIPFAAITGAGIFVYRHTARRRQVQAMLTVLFAASLTLSILVFSSIFLSEPAPVTDPAPQHNVG
jgi:hypothetical protein